MPRNNINQKIGSGDKEIKKESCYLCFKFVQIKIFVYFKYTNEDEFDVLNILIYQIFNLIYFI